MHFNFFNPPIPERTPFNTTANTIMDFLINPQTRIDVTHDPSYYSDIFTHCTETLLIPEEEIIVLFSEDAACRILDYHLEYTRDVIDIENDQDGLFTLPNSTLTMMLVHPSAAKRLLEHIKEYDLTQNFHRQINWINTLHPTLVTEIFPDLIEIDFSETPNTVYRASTPDEEENASIADFADDDSESDDESIATEYVGTLRNNSYQERLKIIEIDPEAQNVKPFYVEIDRILNDSHAILLNQGAVSFSYPLISILARPNPQPSPAAHSAS